MAEEAALDPAAVRQRVSRFRRLLRKKWLREALLVAAAMGALLVVRAALVPDGAAPIVAEAEGGPDAELAATLQGAWRIERIQPDAGAGGTPQAALAAKVVEVRVSGDRVIFASPVKNAERGFRVTSLGGGRFALTIVDGRGGEVRASGAFDGPDRLVLESRDATWNGRVVLAR
jgi:hypothetical protein